MAVDARVLNEMVDYASRIERSEEDLAIERLSRDAVLGMPPEVRLRWFYLHPVWHRELERVADDVKELMEDCNDVTIVALIGLSGVGKTTAAAAIRDDICERYQGAIERGEMPVLYVEAPANGQKSVSWRVTYQRILHAGGEFAVGSKRKERIVNGRLFCTSGRANVGELREFIETMVRQRGIRVLILDEGLHLLRFKDDDAVMDTLKSLSEIRGLKLLLIGSYQLAPLMVQYGQVARRSEIVHFKTYAVPELKDAEKASAQPIPLPPKSGPSSDAYEFYKALEKTLEYWPNSGVPALRSLWWQIMDSCLGSVGLLKMMLLRLAARQMGSPKSEISFAALAKAGKSGKQLTKLKQEREEGARDLEHACYGESQLTTQYAELFKKVLLGEPDATAPAPAAQTDEVAHA